MQPATNNLPRGVYRIYGQAMVEYIIVLPVLLMLVLGAIQFALLYQVKSTLNYATFIGAHLQPAIGLHLDEVGIGSLRFEQLVKNHGIPF